MAPKLPHPPPLIRTCGLTLDETVLTDTGTSMPARVMGAEATTVFVAAPVTVVKDIVSGVKSPVVTTKGTVVPLMDKVACAAVASADALSKRRRRVSPS